MVVGNWSELASWALWRCMPNSERVSSIPHGVIPVLKILLQMDCDEEDSCQASSCEKDDVTANFNFGSSKPDCHNKDGKPFITVIDRSGIHEIGINWCHCPEAPKHDLQLMMAGLFPATFHNPKTAFTFQVLEEFHLDNLECKTTPSQFFSRLKRLTSDEFPNTVLVGDRYQELLRVSRYWRALTSRKRFGFGYGEINQDKPGSMAIFCALCAQPGINLPENWREYENSKTLFMRGFMMDGNFQAEHKRMRNPENDVPLSDGTGFMRSTCHDHLVVNNDRVIGSSFLNLPDNLELRLGIGLFHIHGHQDTCLARYLPSFIEGGRQIDGETMETLWAPLNEISRSTRGMSSLHHWEVIDDHMNDSNWKKLIDIVNALSTRYRRALSGAIASFVAFESINALATPAHVATWTAEEMLAQQKRADDVTAMDIYDIKLKRSSPIPCRNTPRVDREGDRQLWMKGTCCMAGKWVENSGDTVIYTSFGKEDRDPSNTISTKRYNLKKQAANFIHAAADGGYDSCEDTLAREVYIGSKFDGIDKENDDDEGITPPLASQQMQLSENGSTDSSAIVDLGATSSLLDQYKVLTRQHLSVSTSIISPQVRGQRNKSLPWFWTMDVRRDADVGEWMEDVYQVHWLRAKAQKMRWIEELQCLQVEMESAVRFFRHQAQFWQSKMKHADCQLWPGHAAWAERQISMWSSMAMQAESKFTTLLKDNPPPEFELQLCLGDPKLQCLKGAEYELIYCKLQPSCRMTANAQIINICSEMSTERWEFTGRDIVNTPNDSWIVFRNGMDVWGDIGYIPSLTEAQAEGVNMSWCLFVPWQLLKIVHGSPLNNEGLD
ncbi:hypothetical protein EI94DRAFT_1701677 [Lactarius quietus]|nr:hypothetical protein EI94DRAFT_1701677 [Lactarius quietus]